LVSRRKPGIAKGTPPFKAKRKPIYLADWKIQFKAFSKSHRIWESALAGIVKAGCEEDAILELLYAECYENPKLTVGFKKEVRDCQREAGRLAVAVDSLSGRVRRMNEFALGIRDLEENFYLAKTRDGVCAVPLSDFRNLPDVLSFYSQRLRSMAQPIPKLKGIDNRGPELTILAVYIRQLTGAMPYKVLQDLLEAANTFLDRDGFRSEEAVRKSIERWEREHPHAHRTAEEAIVAYVAGRRKGDTPQEPNFWETLYEDLYDTRTVDILKKKVGGSKRTSIAPAGRDRR
jgi:hypothetical protein